MYLSRIYLKNIRCFDELELKLETPGSSIQVIGDNGDGKSTILRSIAMGLCDQSSAAALFRELPGEYVKHGAENKEAFIELDLDAGGGHKYTLRTRFVSLKTFERVEQVITWRQGRRKKTIHADDFGWDRLFVSGYGPGIRSYGTNDFQHYLAVDAVYPLFRYDAMLQNPELIVRRLVDETRKRGRVARTKEQRAERMLEGIRTLLASLLDLDSPREVHLETFGIEIDTSNGKTDLASMGDGYRSTVTWTLDLVSWWMLYVKGKLAHLDTKQMRGIVLVDELEQHLHPLWQTRVLPDLRRVFPNIQFVITSHSPLVAASTKDVVLHRVGKSGSEFFDPYGWLAEDVYQLMGLKTSRALSFTDSFIAKYKRLHSLELQGLLSPTQRAQLRWLRSRLDKLPARDPVRIMTEIKGIRRELERLQKRELG